MLVAQGISYLVRGKFILRDIGIEITPGTVTILIGPNGSGKSTLLKCLAGALHPTTGSVTILTEDLHRMPVGERARRMAYVPQDNPAPFAFRVDELIGLGAGIKSLKSSVIRLPAERQARALQKVELTGLESRSLLTLSGGERQRAAVARALAQEALFLLLDEPTAHLDVRHETLVLRAARETAQEEGTGVLLVLHDLNVAAAWADYLVVLNNGKIVGRGTPQEILESDLLEKVYGIAFTRVLSPNLPGLLLHVSPTAFLNTKEIS